MHAGLPHRKLSFPCLSQVQVLASASFHQRCFDVLAGGANVLKAHKTTF